MPIRKDPRYNRWRFEFDRVIQGARHRASRLLPKGWSQAQADAFDRKEGARLYALATGVDKGDPLIDEAIKFYLSDKGHLKSFKETAEHLAAIAWAYEGKPMSELPAIAKQVIEYPYEKPWAPATIRNRLACLKAACRWAWKKHALTEHDPTARMVLPQVSNERHVYATRKQMLQLARAADRHDVSILIRAAFYTGMRLGELLRVEVDGHMLHLADTKNGTRRSVPAHPRIWSLLDYLPLAAPQKTLQRGWERARARVGLEHVHLHDLRHSAASEMINAEVDLFTVGTVLGHKDPRSTKRYSHLTAKTLANAVGKIGKRVA